VRADDLQLTAGDWGIHDVLTGRRPRTIALRSSRTMFGEDRTAGPAASFFETRGLRPLEHPR
jgi:hypothetical protein